LRALHYEARLAELEALIEAVRASRDYWREQAENSQVTF
jgi:hypothetical protein